jgi:hypothetical protein
MRLRAANRIDSPIVSVAELIRAGGCRGRPADIRCADSFALA